MFQQERHRLVHRPRVDQVVVVQDQHHFVAPGSGGELIDQGRHRPLEGWRCGWTKQGAGQLGDAGLDAVKGRDGVAPEARRVVVASVERYPGRRPLAGLAPVGEQGRLPEPRRGADEDERPLQPLVELLHEPGARDEARLTGWNVQLGGEHPVRGAGAAGREVAPGG